MLNHDMDVLLEDTVSVVYVVAVTTVIKIWNEKLPSEQSQSERQDSN